MRKLKINPDFSDLNLPSVSPSSNNFNATGSMFFKKPKLVPKK